MKRSGRLECEEQAVGWRARKEEDAYFSVESMAGRSY
jgi:hypothetical protein